MPMEIDSLEIALQGTSEVGVSAVDALIGALDKLQTSLSGISSPISKAIRSLDKMSTSLEKMGAASGVTSGAERAAAAMSSIESAATGTAAQISRASGSAAQSVAGDAQKAADSVAKSTYQARLNAKVAAQEQIQQSRVAAQKQIADIKSAQQIKVAAEKAAMTASKQAESQESAAAQAEMLNAARRAQQESDINAAVQRETERLSNINSGSGNEGPLHEPVVLSQTPAAPETTTANTTQSLAEQQIAAQNLRSELERLNDEFSRRAAQPVPEESVSVFQRIQQAATGAARAIRNMFSGSGSEESAGISEMDILNERLANANEGIRIQQLRLEQLSREWRVAFSAPGESVSEETILKMNNAILSARRSMVSYESEVNRVTEQIARLNGSDNDAVSGMDRVSSAMNRASNGTSGLQKTLDRFGRQLLSQIVIYNMVWPMLSKMAQYTGAALMTNNAFASALNNLKVQLLTAFNPIYQAILPALTSFINMLARAMAYVAAFISGFFGKTYQQSQQSAAGLNQNVQAMQALDKATQGATKSQKALADATTGIDELNIIQPPADASNGAASAASAIPTALQGIENTNFNDGKPLISPEQIAAAQAAGAKVAAIFKNISDFAQKYSGPIKTVIEGIVAAFLTFKTITFVQGIIEDISGALAFIASPTAAVVAALALVVGELVYLYNTNQQFHDQVISAWDGIKKTFSTGFDFSGIKKGLTDLQKAFAPFAENVGAGLAWVLQNILAPLAKWTVNTVVPDFLEILAGAFKILNGVIDALKPVGEWLWNNFLEPIAAWTGGVISTILGDIANALNAIGDWINKHQQAVQNIAIVVGAFAAAWALVNIALAAWDLIGAIATGITAGFAVATGALGAAMAILTSPITIIIVAIGVLTAAVILCIKYWPEISEGALIAWDAIKSGWNAAGTFFQNIWSDITAAFKDVKNWFVGVFGDAWTGIQSIWNAVIGWFQNIWTGITDAFNTVKTWFSDTFSGAWTDIQTAWQDVISWFQDIWAGISNVFTSIKDWFSGKFSDAWGAIQTAWSAVVGWFQGIWTGISNVFSTVAIWFSNTFGAAWTGIQTAWEDVTGWFTDVWNKIESVFKPNLITQGFSNAWNGIKSVWSEVTGWFQNIWNTVIGIFKPDMITNAFASAWAGIKTGFSDVVNFLIDGMNTAISAIVSPLNSLISGWNDSVGKVTGDIPEIHIAIPHIPHLANGGLAYSQTLAVVGDNPNANVNPEVIAPLDKLKSIINDGQSNDNSDIIDTLNAGFNNLLTAFINKDFSATLNVDNREIARASNKGNRSMGTPILGGVFAP